MEHWDGHTREGQRRRPPASPDSVFQEGRLVGVNVKDAALRVHEAVDFFS